ncbi:MAG TPA: DUF732 domain-containing protein [Mycobacterium sp.]|nr:DUF732 domain-containing protein [Mycobacterium sp.]
MTLAKLAAAVAAWAIWAAAPAAADPAVQQLKPSLPETPARDSAFLDAITNAGIRVTDVPVAIAGGRDVCAFMATGHSALESVEQGQRNNPSMTREDEISYVNAAITIWCPRMTGLYPIA